ncbi:hypothetical protein EYF70_15625 [Pseudoduganella albidiflava]|uniref:Secreted peptide n=1 Tax=Pseudoduganella albidiflava TaxID=321983 RepID=A0ABX5RVZ2_9BURK|nr:hypothetical protein EYF70_15625 [Pseudoduganella albidiflava]
MLLLLLFAWRLSLLSLLSLLLLASLTLWSTVAVEPPLEWAPAPLCVTAGGSVVWAYAPLQASAIAVASNVLFI